MSARSFGVATFDSEVEAPACRKPRVYPIVLDFVWVLFKIVDYLTKFPVGFNGRINCKPEFRLMSVSQPISNHSRIVEALRYDLTKFIGSSF